MIHSYKSSTKQCAGVGASVGHWFCEECGGCLFPSCSCYNKHEDMELPVMPASDLTLPNSVLKMQIGDGHKELKKLDSDKIMLQLVPVSLVEGIGTILTFGAHKYAPRAWEKGFEWSRAFGALLRHLYAWWKGENLDSETGKSHLWHAGCELAFLIEWETTHPELDDRAKHTAKLQGKEEKKHDRRKG